MKRFGLTALLSLFLVGVSCPLWAKVVYVSPNGNDLNNGLSWATAKRTVTGALQIALPNDQIWVRYGVYVERITLKNGVSLYGGFRGDETSLSQRPAFPRPSPDPYETVLDGNQQGSVVTSPDTANRAYRLDGFTIRNGKAQDGGGLYLTASASYLTVENCTITGNSASQNGGGVYCSSSSPTLTNCTITNNSAGRGGAIWTDSSNTRVLNSVTAFNLGGGIEAPALSQFRGNCVWGNLPTNFAGGIGNPIGSNGNISVDPLLAAGHLLPGSPCINRGDNSVVTVDTDIDGEARVAGGTVDIGADEFHAPIVHGYLLFNDFAASLPLMVDWEIRAGSAEVRPLLIDADGAFVVPRVPSGRFALSVKPLSYLRRTVEVDTSRGSVLNLVISLTNGDIDGDNEVTLFDFGRLVAAVRQLAGTTPIGTPRGPGR